MAEAQYEPGSFRDRRSRVFLRDGRVHRALGEEARRDFEALAATRFYERFQADGRIVATERVEAPGGVPGDAAGASWAAFLRHEQVPFVSYPYEWPFGMLRAAALLQLELMKAALAEGMILKDATPYNVQWRGARPVFIDVGSFERLRPGAAWAGYRQFCELFLYPLMLQAYRGLPFHPWLRGRLEGITADECVRLLSGLDRLRPAVLLHATLQAALQARYGGAEVRSALRAAGVGPAVIEANVRRLTRLVDRLSWEPPRSAWSEYVRTNTYSEPDRERKQAFVREAVEDRPRRLVWDLGCNTGEYSRIAAGGGACVVAMDRDHLAVERLYRALETEGATSILPLVVDVADTPAGLGWRGRERRPLVDRGRPDLVLCLGLVHHLSIGANVPIADLVDWLASLGGDLVVEFVTREDSMVRRLLVNRDDAYADYDTENFERRLAGAFRLGRHEWLASGTRILYYASGRRS